MIQKALFAVAGVILYFSATVSPLFAAPLTEDEPFHRPFNVLWLVVFLMAIAVFLSMAHWRTLRDSEETPVT